MSQLKTDRLIKAIEFARGRGEVGFLISELSAHLCEGKNVTDGIVNRLVTRGNFRSIGSRIVERGPLSRGVRVLVYKFVHDKVPMLEKLANPGKPRNIFEFIDVFGHDEDWNPKEAGQPTAATPGSREKLDVICSRIENGEDLFHPKDIRHGYVRCEPMRVSHA